jgi:putative endonuclease
MSPTTLHTIGDWGERQGIAFLERQGFTVVERNYHTTVGEIDIVATKGGDYYFIEVKTRQAGDMAFDTAVTPAKRKKLLKTISRYLYKHNVIGGSVPASLMVIFDRQTKQVQFRLAVIY